MPTDDHADGYGPPPDLLRLVWALAFARHWSRAALMLPPDPEADEILRLLAPPEREGEMTDAD